MLSFEQINTKINNRLEILDDLRKLVRISPSRQASSQSPIAEKYGLLPSKDMHNNARALTIVMERYNAVVAPLISEYYYSGSKERVTEQFTMFLLSENILGQLDRIYKDFKQSVSGAEAKRLCSAFESNNIILNVNLSHIYDICSECNIKMSLYPEDSELRCESCGNIKSIGGTLFDDRQCFTQDNGGLIVPPRHKRHDPNLHCAKWLYQLQAKESKQIPQSVIDQLNDRLVKEYTRSGFLRSVEDLSCRQMRIWMKEMKLAKLNNHIPYLRKIITGMHGKPVTPPSLTDDEEMCILTDFSLVIHIFDLISGREDVLKHFGKKQIRNKLYYPFFLLKILVHHFRLDPRLPRLLEGIHFQSNNTLAKDDYLWRIICNELRAAGKNYNYEPTDKGAIMRDSYKR